VNRLLDDDTQSPTRAYADQRRASSAYDDDEPAEREISLGTPTLLGIFFALALICACFFGFGYTMGRKSAPSPLVAASTPGASFGASKPAAGSPANSAASHATSSDFVNPSAAPVAAQAVSLPIAASPAAKNAASPADGMIAGDKAPPAPAPQSASAAAQPTGSFVVQVAAVSSQDVANILLASLEKRGYSVGVHHEAQDKLLHVQIGPFADRKAAEAMRQRVLVDGFNAIVK
jgi:DedD protein